VAKTIRIIRPSSREKNNLLPDRIRELEGAGFRILYDEIPQDPAWPHTAGSITDRANAFQNALLESESDFVMVARGGYGASDLLPRLDWNQIKTARPKWLVGFSDISALQSALFVKAGWPAIHGPMLATELWGQNDYRADIEETLAIATGQQRSGTMTIRPVGDLAKSARNVSGTLFGGNLSVLTNLIGTPYFPKSLKGMVVFFEEITENPGELCRDLSHWTLSGVLEGTAAVVIGHLRGLGKDIPDCAPYVYEEMARRTGVPTFATDRFGHTCPNHPLVVGAQAQVSDGQLRWSIGDLKKHDLKLT